MSLHQDTSRVKMVVRSDLLVWDSPDQGLVDKSDEHTSMVGSYSLSDGLGSFEPQIQSNYERVIRDPSFFHISLSVSPAGHIETKSVKDKNDLTKRLVDER